MGGTKEDKGKTIRSAAGLSPQDDSVQNNLVRVEQLIHENQLEAAAQLLSEITEYQHSEYWFLKGLLNQKVQQWGEAMNCFHRCLDLDPEHRGASAGLEICHSILNFWNPSLFNP
jgi:hypothetical protein